jgi:hypothetical protein
MEDLEARETEGALQPVRRENPVVAFFAVVAKPRTWGNLLYLWLSFPLGIAYFVALITGFAAGIPLLIVWIGLFVLFATLALAWLAAGFERQLAIFLLGATVPERLAGAPDLTRRFAQLRRVGESPALWKGIFFLFLKFPLGLAGWVFSVVALSFSLALMATPVAAMLDHDNVRLFWWEPIGFFDALPFGLLGAFGLLVSLHLHNMLGWIWARLAEWLLGATVPPPLEPQPVAAP